MPTHASTSSGDRQRRRLVAGLAVATLLLGIAGLAAGSDGFAFGDLAQVWRALVESPSGVVSVVADIRAPRTVGAWLAGALLGLAGATAQGLFRNPLADPFLIGSAAGAALAVVAVLALAGALVAQPFDAASAATGASVIASTEDASSLAAGASAVTSPDGASSLVAGAAALASTLGLAGAAFAGALLGVGLTLVLARGAEQTTRLLLGGVVVGVVLTAGADLLTLRAPEALRGRQAFMLGSTGYLGWSACALLAFALIATAPLAARLARGLDALALGGDTASSLGMPLARLRFAFVVVLALATGAAVAQTGLVAFVGLASPHIVRRFAPSRHAFTLIASAAAGGALLLAADVLARTLVAPEELPVGVLTALIGGAYLLWLLRRRNAR